MKKNFVIGTGRCGSTLLSSMLAEHPRALVLSEFFGGLDLVNRFREGDVTGQELAEILARSADLSHFWKTRARLIKELKIDFHESAPRWNGHVPVLLDIALPSLTAEPEPLFDAMMDWAKARPSRPLSSHYPALFEWLAERLGRELWIERSGGSFEFLDGLLATFPDARFVHIHRDGPEAALSMLHHPHFQQTVSYHYDPPGAEEVRRTALHLDPPETEAWTRRMDAPRNLRRFGDYWSWSIARGYSVVPRIARENWMELRFEELMADPVGTIGRVADFFGMPDSPGWEARAATLVNSEVPLRGDDLNEDERRDLEAGCEIGQILLGRDLRPSPVVEVTRIAREAFDAQLAGVKRPWQA